MKLTIPINQKFNKLLILKEVEDNRDKYRKVLCRCDCGIEKVMRWAHIQNGSSKSCGCYRVEAGKMNFKHGFSKSCSARTEYEIWNGLKKRCYNENCPAYKDYGSRGITVCDRWTDKDKGFENFFEDMGTRPGKGYSIDRIDNDKGYYKENCRWATRAEQARNTRASLKVSYKGEIKPLKDWCEILNLHYGTTQGRITTLGWEVEAAFETPAWGKRHIK